MFFQCVVFTGIPISLQKEAYRDLFLTQTQLLRNEKCSCSCTAGHISGKYSLGATGKVCILFHWRWNGGKPSEWC